VGTYGACLLDFSVQFENTTGIISGLRYVIDSDTLLVRFETLSFMSIINRL